MADEKLRRELLSLGYTPPPITDSTRGVLEKKLQKLRAEAKKPRSSRRRETRNDEEETRETPTGDRRQSQGTVRGWRAAEQEDGGWREESSWRTAGRQEDTEESSWRTAGRQEGTEESSWRTAGRQEGTEESSWRTPVSLTDRSSLGQHRYSGEEDSKRSSLDHPRYSGDNPVRSSLDHPRYSGDNPARSSLDHPRYSGDNPVRSSLDHQRYPGNEPARSSLGHYKYSGEDHLKSSLDHQRYSRDGSERSSLGHYKYLGEKPERSSLDHHRYLSTDTLRRSLEDHERYSGEDSDIGFLGRSKYLDENPLRSSLDHPRYSGGELRSRFGGDSKEQSTSPYTSSRRTLLDSPSYTTHPDLKQEKSSHLKPGWSRKLEYYLSRLLRVLCLILVLVFIGILVVKSGVLSPSQDNGMKLLPSDCEGKKDTFCKTKQKEIILQILSELYEFLSFQAGSFECGNPSGLRSKCIPINRAKEHVMNGTGYSAEKFDAAMEWMLSSDRHLGIWAKDQDTEEFVTVRTDNICVESSQPRLGYVCRLKNALYTAISNLFLALLGIFILWIILIFLRYHWQRLEEEEKQMFAMVEKIIDVVKLHYKDWTLGREQNPYVGILHVRDSLIMPQDRKHLKKVWDHAVQFVEDNESRVRTELQRMAGADLRVWRWTQTRNGHPR